MAVGCSLNEEGRPLRRFEVDGDRLHISKICELRAGPPRTGDDMGTSPAECPGDRQSDSTTRPCHDRDFPGQVRGGTGHLASGICGPGAGNVATRLPRTPPATPSPNTSATATAPRSASDGRSKPLNDANAERSRPQPPNSS